jgi:metal-sulfur cluster biosynthetic enzyme
MVNDVLRRIEKRLHSVMDPELPFLTVMELGMIRGIVMESDTVVIELTPTYTGCPATDAITEDLQKAVRNIRPCFRSIGDVPGLDNRLDQRCHTTKNGRTWCRAAGRPKRGQGFSLRG